MNNRDEQKKNEQYPSTNDQQGIDKAPGEEQGQAEQVTKNDLTGKKVDADPERPFEQPIRQLP